jgi:hypothetical protein
LVVYADSVGVCWVWDVSRVWVWARVVRGSVICGLSGGGRGVSDGRLGCGRLEQRAER